MSQNFQLGLLGQAVTVNATTNAVSVNSSVNATAFSIGTSWIANTTGVTIANTSSMTIGNTTVNTYITTTSLKGSNTYANGTAITGGTGSITTLDGFFIDCGVYS